MYIVIKEKNKNCLTFLARVFDHGFFDSYIYNDI